MIYSTTSANLKVLRTLRMASGKRVISIRTGRAEVESIENDDTPIKLRLERFIIILRVSIETIPSNITTEVPTVDGGVGEKDVKYNFGLISSCNINWQNFTIDCNVQVDDVPPIVTIEQVRAVDTKYILGSIVVYLGGTFDGNAVRYDPNDLNTSRYQEYLYGHEMNVLKMNITYDQPIYICEEFETQKLRHNPSIMYMKNYTHGANNLGGDVKRLVDVRGVPQTVQKGDQSMLQKFLERKKVLQKYYKLIKDDVDWLRRYRDATTPETLFEKGKKDDDVTWLWSFVRGYYSGNATFNVKGKRMTYPVRRVRTQTIEPRLGSVALMLPDFHAIAPAHFVYPACEGMMRVCMMDDTSSRDFKHNITSYITQATNLNNLRKMGGTQEFNEEDGSPSSALVTLVDMGGQRKVYIQFALLDAVRMERVRRMRLGTAAIEEAKEGGILFDTEMY